MADTDTQTPAADPQAAAPQQGQQQVRVNVDESKMTSAYANTIRTASTADEIILDFGVNIPQQGQDGQAVMNFAVGSRVVLSWATAKRLLGTLHQNVSAYEARFGEIDLRPKQPKQQ